MKKAGILRLFVGLVALLLWNCSKDEPTPAPFVATDFEVIINSVTQAGTDYRVNYSITNKSSRRYDRNGNPRFNIVFSARTADGTVTAEEGIPELDPGARQSRITLVGTDSRQATITAEIRPAQ